MRRIFFLTIFVGCCLSSTPVFAWFAPPIYFYSTRQQTLPTINNRHWFAATTIHNDPSTESSANIFTNNSKQHQLPDALARFHSDMRRVLSSRSHALGALVAQTRKRRNRPALLESDADGAERAFTMLRHVQSLHMATEETYQIVMEAFVKRDRIRWNTTNKNHTQIIMRSADQVEVLLQELEEQLSSQQQQATSISVTTYNLALQAYANCATPRGDVHYARRADVLLRRMGAKANIASYMHVIHAYAWEQANLQVGDCALRATQIMNENILVVNQTASVAHNSSTCSAQELMQCYDWVLEAWSKSENGAEQANHMLQQMKALNATHPSSLLDAETYSNAILAWSKASDSAVQCETLLAEMLQCYKAGAFPRGSEPTLIAFNGVITAWGRMGRADKAEQILKLMEETRPLCKKLVPDAVSYNSVLHAKRGRKTLDRVLQIVRYMEDNCGDQPAITPNSFTYNILIKAWIQSDEAETAEQAEKALDAIVRLWSAGDESLERNNRIFNMVINAYAKCDHSDAAQKALALLVQIKELNDIEPDAVTYACVLECLSKSEDPTAPEHAEKLLEELFQQFETTNNPDHMPNLRTFTMAILTFARNNGSVKKARGLLTRLLDLYETTRDPHLRPSAYPYNYVLNCAANALDNKTEAFHIATQTYQGLRKSEIVRPDSFTYAFWLKCCNNLLPLGELRDKCVTFAFEECKKEGLVTKVALTRLLHANRPELVNKLLELNQSSERIPYRSLRVTDLPPSWSRNAKPGMSNH
jgi:pentatricopeptide repeat protein